VCGFDMSSFARSLPSLHQLLPEYACFETPTGLRKTTEISMPLLDAHMVNDAMQFHNDLNEVSSVGSASWQLYPTCGLLQPTATTATIAHDRVITDREIDRTDEYGDGTVPRLSSRPKGMTSSDPDLHLVTEQHGTLQSNASVFDRIRGVATCTDTQHRSETYGTTLGVGVDELVRCGDPLVVAITGESNRDVVVEIADEQQRIVAAELVPTSSLDRSVAFADLRPGAYLVRARPTPGRPREPPDVVGVTLVCSS
jgi:hypothetical protein